MEKNTSTGSALILGVTASLGVGYLLGSKKKDILSAIKNAQSNSGEKLSDQDEVERLIRANILKLAPYRCARDDYDRGILLDANENSLGPPFEAKHDLRKEILERYPCPYQKDLKQVIADYRNIGAKTPLSPANIFLGVGSDEAIDLIIRIACNPRIDSIIITPPTYGMYEVCANIHDVNIISVPLVREEPGNNPLGLKEGLPLPAFHIDPHQILKAATPETKIIFLCSPGNPTANSLRLKDVETILNAPSYKGFIVVDEAYIDFAEHASLCTLVNEYNRLIVLQTLSKGFGLAGIRLGSAFGHPRLIQLLNNVKAPYNINKLTAKVALEALHNTKKLEENVAVIKKEKEKVYKKLRQFRFVKCIYASDSNFILFEVPNAFKVYKEMASRGVVIRYRGNQLHLKDCLRATIGSAEENDKMLELLKQVSIELGAKA